MVALILKSAPIASREGAAAHAAIERLDTPQVDDVLARTASWRGMSGRRYLHTVYDFVTCPALVGATVILVKRDTDGIAIPCHIDATQSDCASLNLAFIRQRGAELGICEVHVHFSATSDEARALAVCDLRAGLFGSLAAEPALIGQSTNDTAAPLHQVRPAATLLVH